MSCPCTWSHFVYLCPGTLVASLEATHFTLHMQWRVWPQDYSCGQTQPGRETSG